MEQLRSSSLTTPHGFLIETQIIFYGTYLTYLTIKNIDCLIYSKYYTIDNNSNHLLFHLNLRNLCLDFQSLYQILGRNYRDGLTTCVKC